ncbi:hypothetical protein [Asinibacterium sp. OR53]|uniref:hypothetical protein n=1 Tax=Asinibacterium sp. OR53 TaxID=925409 RepID=UPI000478CF8B|nr:hypothetical protein [Asinibacterium sp. OR53]
MKKINKTDSIEIIVAFITHIQKDSLKKPVPIEYFELTLSEPIYEKCNCAYIQTANLKEGLLYEAIINRYFYIKSTLINRAEKKYAPTLSILDTGVSSLIPEQIRSKMFRVCGNKKDDVLESGDFADQFILKKQSL